MNSKYFVDIQRKNNQAEGKLKRTGNFLLFFVGKKVAFCSNKNFKRQAKCWLETDFFVKRNRNHKGRRSNKTAKLFAVVITLRLND